MATRKANPTSNTQELVEHEEISLITTLPNPKMGRAIHLYLTGQYSYNKIAQLLEVHPNTILKWFKREDVKTVIADLQESTHELVATQMKNMSLQALDRLRELMNSPIDGVALQAVKDVLDRTGHKPKNEIKVDKTVTTIEQKLNTLIESTIDIDAEFEDVIE